MSLERIRCTLIDVRSGKSISASLVIHQSMITNIRIWCTKHPGQMELFMSRDRIESVQKELLHNYDFDPVFIAGDGRQTLHFSHDKVSSYLKTLDSPLFPGQRTNPLCPYSEGSSGKRRFLLSSVKETVVNTDTSRCLTRPYRTARAEKYGRGRHLPVRQALLPSGMPDPEIGKVLWKDSGVWKKRPFRKAESSIVRTGSFFPSKRLPFRTS